MNTEEQNNNSIDAILRETYRGVEPPDSWEGLRERIDRRIDSKGTFSIIDVEVVRSIVFWRRLAFGMAACFLLTAGLLVYWAGFKSDVQEYQRQQLDPTANNTMFTPSDLNRLSVAFSQVRQLFGQQSPWLVVGSGNSGEIGVDNQTPRKAGADKVIVLRLVLNSENQGEKHRYFDVVMFANQQASFHLPLLNDTVMFISLMPTLKDDRMVAVELEVQINGGSKAWSISTVADNVFTSLARLRANGSWVNIDGIGRLMPES